MAELLETKEGNPGAEGAWQFYQPSSLNLLNRLFSASSAQDPMVLFVGAGLSKDYSLPSWDELLMKAARRVKFERETAVLLRLKLYERAAELLCRRFEKQGRIAFDEYLIREFNVLRKQPKRPTAVEAVIDLVRKQSRFGATITTNFDNILESVAPTRNHTFTPLVHVPATDGLLDERLFAPGSKALLKLHGDLNLSHHRVLLREEYERHYCDSLGNIDLKKHLPNLLRHVFTHRSILFLGCRLEEDRYLRLLQSTRSENAPSHFAVLTALHHGRELDEDSETNESRRERLRRMGIDAIEFPAGAYQCIPAFLRFVEDWCQAMEGLRGGFKLHGIAHRWRDDQIEFLVDPQLLRKTGLNLLTTIKTALEAEVDTAATPRYRHPVFRTLDQGARVDVVWHQEEARLRLKPLPGDPWPFLQPNEAEPRSARLKPRTAATNGDLEVSVKAGPRPTFTVRAAGSTISVQVVSIGSPQTLDNPTLS